jgi:hypothetical protein
MVSGGHVIEFDAPRPLKLMQLAPATGPAEIAEELIWIGRRPTADTISRRPTRDYFFLTANGAVLAAPPLRPAVGMGRIATTGLPHRLPGLEARLSAIGAELTSLDGFSGEVLGGIVSTSERPSVSTDGIAAAWSAAAPLVRHAFLSLQKIAIALEAQNRGTIIVVLPPYSTGTQGLFLDVLSAGLLGLARSAASALVKSNVAVHAVHEPATAAGGDGFARLVAALLADGAQTGGLFAADGDHVASFVFEMPVWQHFSEAKLDDHWLASISTAVSSRGRDWPRPGE